MCILSQNQVCGVTATAHKQEGGQEEKDLFAKFGFTTLDLFPGVEFPEALHWTDVNYWKMRALLVAKEYAGYAKLVLGWFDTIQAYC